MPTSVSPYVWSEYNENGQRRWSRQLGGHEAAFYWDGELSGACDVLSSTHIALDVSHAHILADAEIIQGVWRAVKYRHPLLGVSVIEDNASQTLQYLIKEERIQNFYPGEVELRVAETMDEFNRIRAQYDYGPRMISAEYLSKLVVVKIPSPTDDARLHYYIFIATSHSISDAVASFNIARTFLEMLSAETLTTSSIADRLAMLPAIDHLFTNQNMSPARRHWRKAVAKLIMQRRMERMQGGTIVPNRVTTESLFKPALGRKYTVELTTEETQTILSRCRSQGITFGHAFHVLCQLANASIIRDVHFDQQELEYRRRQPSHFFSPLGIRPFLDKTWLEKGGMTEVLATGSNYHCTLPFLPLQGPRHEMLSKERFFYRCRLVKKEMSRQLKHPLLLDFAALYSKVHEAERSRFSKLWRDRQRNPESKQVEKTEEDQKFFSATQVSSFGAIDVWLPKTYPYDSKKPFITLLDNTTWARTFPGSFYTTAAQWNERLWVGSSWDGNVYDDEMIIQWVNNLAQFIRQYLTDSRPVAGERARL